jgi:hypothetical protein
MVISVHTTLGRRFTNKKFDLHYTQFSNTVTMNNARVVEALTPGSLVRITAAQALFVPISPLQTLYQDRVEFAVSHRAVLNRVAAAVLRPLLALAFARRHRIVRAGVVGGTTTPARQRVAAAAVAAATMLLAETAQNGDSGE